ncbi:glycoside hydrolase family 5 protein [Legionella resiliens]|uniref:Glycoside hydrolase family 5 protein n=1 Tax=Legionella resiliens TaxID=2905958 RepID=A0ABS8X580_9GAMM|nr:MULTISPECIES: glycoside hydrolase family 5 protein [unclassified Legionella]MCE0723762.1 glycoside hydrolase family 5 protein [Legionella sp. 9fVS26]MCE3532914.1 glycoside hydrolase family 5 protein [Legionella sp. 8cVS16]
MKYPLLGLISFITITQGVIAQPVKMAAMAQPTACITSQFSAIGDQHWKTVTLKLTNNCSQAVDFQNSTITFKSKTSISTSFWGDFSPLSYPDNALNIASQLQTDGAFLATFTLHFPSYPGANSKLPVGSSFQIKYGVSSDNHIESSVNVYTGSVIESGILILNNASSKPANVSQNYALVHLSFNGQIINNIQLPWATATTLTGLAAGNYSLAPESVSGSNGDIYQGSAVPSTFTLTANQTVNAAVNYTLMQPTGKLAINLQALPSELSGYGSNPTALITQSQTGSSVTQPLTWNTLTTVPHLKEGEAYTFSTPSINYNGYNCVPSFSPTSLVASSATTPSTNLTYQCVQVVQDTVTINVSGAPAHLNTLTVVMTPNDGSNVISKVIDLNNGNGSSTVQLTDGVIYTFAAEAVSGYSINFSPQPLTATASAVETITMVPIDANTPVGLNGQLTVCGTKLCNEHGTAIQLKGMSTHGLQWFAQCATPASLDFLTNNFKANVIRLSLYVQEGGYETNPTKFTNDVSQLIDEASERGVYVIVDWHILNPGDPNYNLNSAKKFFTDIASIHKNKNNILYEIANEPNGVGWNTIKSYANEIIPVIRAIDPKAPIIIGTRGWSSLGVSDGSSYQEIVNNPVQFSNIMYAFHFYAASHRENYLSALDSASQVLPIFVTEFGTQTYTGDGANDFVMSDRYMQLMAVKKISWANWNYSDDYRSGAIWKTNTCASGAWVDSNLKPAGVYIKGQIQTSPARQGMLEPGRGRAR